MPSSGNVSILGTLSPGNSPGTLTFSGPGTLDVSSALSGGLNFELGTPGDLVLLTNNAVLKIGSGVLNFDDFTFTPVNGFGLGTYTLFDTAQTIVGSLGTGASLWGRVGGNPAVLTLSGDGTDLLLNVVPEPSTLALLGFGFAGLLGWHRRRRSGLPA
jgi:hypothetical protein